MNYFSTAGIDRIDLFLTFIRIVDAGSLSAAAAQLGTTHPTVSRRLQALEQRNLLNDPLIVFSSDHGEFLGHHGLLQKSIDEYPMLYDDLLHVPLIGRAPGAGGGRVVDDLVEFTDMMPTLCEVTGADLPKNHPADGASIVPVLQNKADARKKDWIYIWYRGRVMVRNKEYSLVAKTDGSGAALTRYKGPFDGRQLENSALTKDERSIKEQFEGTLARLARTRLSGVSEEVRAKLEKPKKKDNK